MLYDGHQDAQGKFYEGDLKLYEGCAKAMQTQNVSDKTDMCNLQEA